MASSSNTVIKNLFENLSHFQETQPEEYQNFIENVSEEYKRLHPRPHTCIQIYERGQSVVVHLDLWAWSNVPACLPERTHALPLHGGKVHVAQGRDCYFARVSVNPKVLSEYPSNSGKFAEFMEIVFQFLEHVNPGRSFERRWTTTSGKTCSFGHLHIPTEVKVPGNNGVPVGTAAESQCKANGISMGKNPQIRLRETDEVALSPVKSSVLLRHPLLVGRKKTNGEIAMKLYPVRDIAKASVMHKQGKVSVQTTDGHSESVVLNDHDWNLTSSYCKGRVLTLIFRKVSN